MVGYAQPNGSTKGEPHAWNKLLIDNKWVTLDPTWTAKGEEGYAYFNFDDKLASKSRKEENDMKYPAALSMDLFYYKVK